MFGVFVPWPVNVPLMVNGFRKRAVRIIVVKYLHDPVELGLDGCSGEVLVHLHNGQLFLGGDQHPVSIVQQTGNVHTTAANRTWC